MGMMKRIIVLSLVAVATLFIQNADATLTKLVHLPDSLFAEEENNWQGYRLYNEDGFYVLVEFTVYDTQRPGREQDEIDLSNALAAELDMTGQYIYAYQIFNHATAEKDVGYFKILNLDESPIVQALDDIGSYDDESDGVEPVMTLPEGIWAFAGGALIASTHSWFLVFSSNFAPVAGTFTIESPSDFPVIPEPATIVLLGIGGSVIFAMRRRKFLN